MNIERTCVKFFTTAGEDIEAVRFINIFHEWFRNKKLEGVLLDVADYSHVPEGPGVMLLTHDINYGMDYGDGQFGLLAQRKRGQGQTPFERILELVGGAITFGALLEQEAALEGTLRLEGGSFHFMSNDRLLAPNTETAYEVIKADLAAAVEVIYPGRQINISRVDNDPRDRLTLAVDTGTSISLSKLFEELNVNA
jgi:hypothetical protein